MKKGEFKTTNLDKGEINRYQGGKLNLLVYKTNDPLDDFSLILEKERRGLVIEPPCFTANIEELETYFSFLHTKVEGVLLSYHQAGGTFYRGAKRYSTRNAVEYGTQGRGKLMVDKFAETFGSAFDPTFHEGAAYIDGDSVSIAGITLNIHRTPEAFDVEIPEIRAKYIHLLGHDVHSIIGSLEELGRELSKLEDCLKGDYDLLLSSHYPAEDPDDVRLKIDYLKRLQHFAGRSHSADEFKLAMRKEFPEYRGDHYLAMTAQALFH